MALNSISQLTSLPPTAPLIKCIELLKMEIFKLEWVNLGVSLPFLSLKNSSAVNDLPPKTTSNLFNIHLISGSSYRYQLEAFVAGVRALESGTPYDEIPETAPVWVRNEESVIFAGVVDQIYEKGGMKKRTYPSS